MSIAQSSPKEKESECSCFDAKGDNPSCPSHGHSYISLYEMTHNMTDETAELMAHPRSCRCPLCEGDPEDWS